MEGEILELKSGKLVVLDQFMLTNEQFLESADVSDFGGVQIDLEPGTYRVSRQGREKMLIVYKVDDADAEQQEDMAEVLKEQAEYEKERGECFGDVCVDTRCIVFVDSGFLENKDLMDAAATLRKEGKFKPARDELRTGGAVIRYGFSRKTEVFRSVKLGADSCALFGTEEPCM